MGADRQLVGNLGPDSHADIDEVVTAVLTASRLLIAVSARSLASVEDTVTLSQFRTLVILASRGEMNLNQLAKFLQVNASTAMRMIDRLLVTQLVTRRDNPANRREVLLGLSANGEDMVRDVTTKRQKEIARIVSSLTSDQRVDLVNALRAVNQAGSEPEASLISGRESVTEIKWQERL
jgi:DNA-binding MarR family transcriptional regulator